MTIMEIIDFFMLRTIEDPTCKKHTSAILKNLVQFKPWALRLFDSSAKLAPGLLTGNFRQFGNMDECTSIKASGDFGEFTGKFCMAHFPFKLRGQDMEYQSGICIPSTCSANDLKYFLRYVLQFSYSDVNELDCNVLNEERPYQPKEVFTILIISLLLLVVLLSTIYDCCKSEKKNVLFQMFSLKLNGTDLLNTSAPAAPLDFLHGMRFFAIACVVLAHVYMVKIGTKNSINEIVAIDWMSDYGHVWLTSRGTVVDLFFVMGGLLTSYTFLKNRDRGKRFSLVNYWIHRYMRMAPTMFMILLFEATLTNRLGSGPTWKTVSKVNEEACQQDWWKHVLFINNWWGIEKCLPHTWYIAADMQLNCLAPLFLIPLHRRPRFGLGLVLGTSIISFFVTFGLAIGYEEKVDITRNFGSEIERELYRGTYNRLIPWLAGFALGYFMYKYNYMNVLSAERKVNNKISEKCSKFLFGLVLWILTFAILSISIFGVHPFIQPDYVYNAVESAAFLATTHITVTIAAVMAFVLCWIGYGGPFGVFFKWRFFLPLSKLSYSMYIIHLTVIKMRLYDVRTTEYLSDINILMHWISILVCTALAAPILTLLVEIPFTRIEVILQHKFNPDNGKPDPEANAVTSYGTLSSSQGIIEGHVNDAYELSENSRRRKPEQNPI